VSHGRDVAGSTPICKYAESMALHIGSAFLVVSINVLSIVSRERMTPPSITACPHTLSESLRTILSGVFVAGFLILIVKAILMSEPPRKRQNRGQRLQQANALRPDGVVLSSLSWEATVGCEGKGIQRCVQNSLARRICSLLRSRSSRRAKLLRAASIAISNSHTRIF